MYKYYVDQDAVYIGPFNRDLVVKGFYNFIELLNKYATEKGIDLENVSYDLASIYDDGRWMKYFIGLYIEDYDMDRIKEILLDVLKKAKFINDEPALIEIREKEYYPSFRISKEYEDVKIDKRIDEIKIIDKLTDYYSRLGERIIFGIIRIINWLNELGEAHIDYDIKLHINLSGLIDEINNLYKIIKDVKEHEGEIYITEPIVREVSDIYDLSLNTVKLGIYSLNQTLPDPSDERFFKDASTVLSTIRDLRDIAHRYINDLKNYVGKNPENIDLSKQIKLLRIIIREYGLDGFIDDVYNILDDINDNLDHMIKNLQSKTADLNDIEELLRLLNNIMMNIKFIEIIHEHVGYTPFPTTSEEMKELFNSIERRIAELLRNIPKQIYRLDTLKIYQYISERNEFYDYIVYPLEEVLINKQDEFLKYDHRQLFKSITKLLFETYMLKYLPRIYEVYNLTPWSLDEKLVSTYRNVFKPKYVEELDLDTMNKLLKYFGDKLQKRFRELLIEKIYSAYRKNLRELAIKGDIKEIINRLSEVDKSVKRQLIDEEVWPIFRERIDDLARTDPMKAIEYIDKLLSNDVFRFAVKDSAEYYIEKKLLGKKIALRRIMGKSENK